MRLFMWRRLYALSLLVEGVVALLTPFRTGLPLACARRIARANGRRLIGGVG